MTPNRRTLSRVPISIGPCLLVLLIRYAPHVRIWTNVRSLRWTIHRIASDWGGGVSCSNVRVSYPFIFDCCVAESWLLGWSKIISTSNQANSLNIKWFQSGFRQTYLGYGKMALTVFSVSMLFFLGTCHVGCIFLISAGEITASRWIPKRF